MISAGSTSLPNRWLAILLIALLALMPLPFGSHRPVFWALSAVILGLAGIIYLSVLHKTGKPLRFTLERLGPALWISLAYLAFLALQLAPIDWRTADFPQGEFRAGSITLSKGDTLLALLRAATHGLLFFLVLQVAVNRARARMFVWYIFGIITCWALYGLMALTHFGDTILSFEKWAYAGYVTGPFVNRNSFATYLSMGLICGTGLLMGLWARPANTSGQTQELLLRTCVIAVLLAMILLALLQTGSRMGVFSGLCGTIMTIVLIVIGRGRANLIFLAGLAVSGIVLVGIVMISDIGSGLLSRLEHTDASAFVRRDLYLQILGMIAERPLTGWGADSFAVVFPAFRTAPVDPGLTWELAHSTYLAHWVETGVIFGSIPPLLMAIAFIACIRTVLRRQTDIVLPAIAAGAIMTGALHSLLDFSLEIQANVWTLLALVALALPALTNRNRSGARS